MNKTFSNQNQTKKIIINKRSDLINIPIQQLRTAQLKNFSGVLFEQIYNEAIAIEHNQNKKIKKELLESKEHSRSFIHKTHNEMINNNIDDNYKTSKSNALERSGVIKKINKEQKIEFNNIKFEIKYDTKYGEEVGILGSNNELGNWNINNIFHLRWNNGNIWIGNININEPYINFEFKFVITFNKEIKKWENGENNKIFFDSLINKIKYNNRGYLNKCEYYYDNINKELYLKCKWN